MFNARNFRALYTLSTLTPRLIAYFNSSLNTVILNVPVGYARPESTLTPRNGILVSSGTETNTSIKPKNLFMLLSDIEIHFGIPTGMLNDNIEYGYDELIISYEYNSCRSGPGHGRMGMGMGMAAWAWATSILQNFVSTYNTYNIPGPWRWQHGRSHE